MKIYKIRVKMDEGLNIFGVLLDGEYTVLFDHVLNLKHKDTTFCSIRKSVSTTPFAGVAIRNPHDEADSDKGEREAFKRAVKAMLIETIGKWEVQDAIVSRFRGALRIAKSKEI